MLRRNFLAGAASVPLLGSTIGSNAEELEECTVTDQVDALLTALKGKYGGNWEANKDTLNQFMLITRSKT